MQLSVRSDQRAAAKELAIDLRASWMVGGSSAVRIYYHRDLSSNPPPLGDTLDDFPGFPGGIFVG